MMSACIHQIFFKDIETFSCEEENFTRTMRSLGNDISYDVPPCVLSHQIFSPYSEIVTVTRSFPTTRLTPRQRFAQLVSNDAAKRQGPLECTYILNLTYAHLRTASTLCSSSLPLFTSAPFSLLRAPVKTYALTRALTYVSVCVDTFTRSRVHWKTREEEEEKQREREREREREKEKRDG